MASRGAKISGTKVRLGMVNAWRMRTELGIEIAHRIYLYLVRMG